MRSYHAAHLTPDPARTGVWRVIAEYLAPWIPHGAHVLEIGAGYCDWINHVRADRRVAVDTWHELPAWAGRGVEAAVLDAASGLTTLGRARFDTVLASNVLEHFAPDVAASVVADVFGLLKPGGRFILIQPNFRYAYREYFDDYTHRAVFSDVSLPALLRAQGLDIEVVHPRFLPYTMQNARVRPRAWMVRAYLHSPIRPHAGQMLVIARKS
jgi:SAM-dependent methyltransferase